MGTLINHDFEDGTIGQEPDGWSVVPINCSLIAADPIDPPANQGKVVRFSNGSLAYHFADSVVGGIVSFEFFILREDTASSDSLVFSLFNDTQELTGFQMAWDRNLFRYPDNGHLYTESGYQTSTPVAYEADTWYYFGGWIDLDREEMTLFLGGVGLLGYDDNGQWSAAIPFHVSTDTVGGIRFIATNVSVQAIGYIDEVISYAMDHQDQPPERITFITDFELDQIESAHSFLDSSEPNQQSADFAAVNVLHDSLEKSWRSETVQEGFHRLMFDFGEEVEKELRFVAVAGHNLNLPTINLLSIKFFGGESPGLLWSSPKVLIDLTDNRLNPLMIGWIPEHEPCRYYGLQIEVYSAGLNKISNIEIGRIIGATEYFTPGQQFGMQYRMSVIDPSIVNEMEGGVRQSRIIPSFKALEFGWKALEATDQSALLLGYVVKGGIHKPWLVLVEPAEGSSELNVYGYLEKKALTANRGFKSRGQLKMSFREIVS